MDSYVGVIFFKKIETRNYYFIFPGPTLILEEQFKPAICILNLLSQNQLKTYTHISAIIPT